MGRERYSRRRDSSEEYEERRRRRRAKERHVSDRSPEREKRQRRRRDEDKREKDRRSRRSRSRSRSRSRERHRKKRSTSPGTRHDVSKDKRQKQEKNGGAAAAESGKIDFSADITPEDVQLMQAMGIPFGFQSTQGTHVGDDEANTGAIRTKSLRQARQYMNRKGGFNRPLPPERTGQKVVRD